MKDKLFALTLASLLSIMPAIAASNKNAGLIGQIPPPPNTRFEVPPSPVVPGTLQQTPVVSASTGDETIAESKPYVARGTSVQHFVDYVNLRPGQEKLPLTLTFSNQGFYYISCSIAGYPIFNQKNITGQSNFAINMTGNMPGGSSQILINAVGINGATLNWEITTPKISLNSVKPYEVGAGETINLLGNNFCPEAKWDKVEIGNKASNVVSATSTNISAKVPDNVESGKQKLVLIVAGQKVGETEVLVQVAPEITYVNAMSAPPGTTITIYGKHFAKKLADNKVTIGGVETPVVSGDTTSLNVIIPLALDTMNPAWGVPITVQVGKLKSKENVTINIQTRVF